LGNDFLGQGCFQGYVDFDTQRGRQILDSSELYSQHGTPGGAKGFIELTTVRTARPGESLAGLGGMIRASGLALTLANIPPGASRAQVYFLTEREIY